ncbi:TetR/AcrR family transcriptional regulator [Rhodococcus gannanensis]|uniref:TetR/AcrR family transcriptional regulator n=1 Tax=Rhodococcus gannanensis TaxID=1960308 RepID=A0ABW4NZQ5_9NOCA
MPRLQEFDTEVVVSAVRDVFWDKGYEETSVPDLERATGLNRSSLYNAFGSKRGLFDAAVQDYLDRIVRPRLRILTGEPTPVDAAVRYYRSLSAALGALPDESSRGCLLLNSAAGFAAHDDAQRAVVDAYRSELAAALAHALRALDPSSSPADLDRRTRILSALSISALLLSRVNRSEAVALAEAAIDQLGEWAPAQSYADVSPEP